MNLDLYTQQDGLQSSVTAQHNRLLLASHLQLADASHGARQQHQEHARGHSRLALAIGNAVGRQVGGHQRGGACGVRADAGSREAVGVGHAADQEVHAIAGRQVARHSHAQGCVRNVSG